MRAHVSAQPHVVASGGATPTAGRRAKVAQTGAAVEPAHRDTIVIPYTPAADDVHAVDL